MGMEKLEMEQCRRKNEDGQMLMENGYGKMGMKKYRMKLQITQILSSVL